MPVCTEEMNLPGSSPRRSAVAAPLSPRSARILSRAGRAETTASSDMDRKPLSSASATTIKISNSKLKICLAWPVAAQTRYIRFDRARVKVGEISSAIGIAGEGILAAANP